MAIKRKNTSSFLRNTHGGPLTEYILLFGAVTVVIALPLFGFRGTVSGLFDLPDLPDGDGVVIEIPVGSPKIPRSPTSPPNYPTRDPRIVIPDDPDYPDNPYDPVIPDDPVWPDDPDNPYSPLTPVLRPPGPPIIVISVEEDGTCEGVPGGGSGDPGFPSDESGFTPIGPAETMIGPKFHVAPSKPKCAPPGFTPHPDDPNCWHASGIYGPWRPVTYSCCSGFAPLVTGVVPDGAKVCEGHGEAWWYPAFSFTQYIFPTLKQFWGAEIHVTPGTVKGGPGGSGSSGACSSPGTGGSFFGVSGGGAGSGGSGAAGGGTTGGGNGSDGFGCD